MADVKGLQSLVNKLGQQIDQVRQGANGHVVVGYTAGYAVFVHENAEQVLIGLPRPSGLGNYFDPAGRAAYKFLESPARELTNSGELRDIIRDAMKSGKTPMQACLLAGLRVQQESQKRVPIEYGDLRASAFTAIEE